MKKNKPRYDSTAKVMSRFKALGMTDAVKRRAEAEGRCYQHPGNFLPCERDH